MNKLNRPNRKATDADIIRHNSLGRSLKDIAKLLDVHPTTVTLRLQALGIEPADTRRAFMKNILMSLTPAQEQWLADQLGPHVSINDYVRGLIVKEFVNQN